MPLINTRGAASIKGFGFAGFSPTVPAAPTIGAATATSATTATIAFTAGCSGGLPITGYQAISSPGCITATGSSSPISFSGLTHSTSYTFKVRAQNSLGYGPYSNSSSSITTNNVVPNAPTSVSASATSSSSISVYFTASSCNGGASIDYYQAVCTSTGSHSATGSSPISITGLCASTSYTFKVRAHNSVGYSCYSSSTGTATTSAAPGSSLYSSTGVYTFTVPAGVTSVSAMVISRGYHGYCGGRVTCCCPGVFGGQGGFGGNIAWGNNISVSPGSSYTVRVASCTYYNCQSRFGCLVYALVCRGDYGGTAYTNGHCGSYGGYGQYTYGYFSYAMAGGGGGGAGAGAGYGGMGCGNSSYTAGHNGGCGGGGGGAGGTCASGGAGGGGIGAYGLGSSGNGGAHGGSSGCVYAYGGCGGSGGSAGSNVNHGANHWNGANGGSYGGGGGGGAWRGSGYCVSGTPGSGAGGFVRIVWPGNTRSWPSSCVGSP